MWAVFSVHCQPDRQCLLGAVPSGKAVGGQGEDDTFFIETSMCPGVCRPGPHSHRQSSHCAHHQPFYPEQLVTGKEDGASNHAHRHHAVGKGIVLGTGTPSRSCPMTSVLEKHLKQTLSHRALGLVSGPVWEGQEGIRMQKIRQLSVRLL